MPFIITDSWEGNDILLDLNVMYAGGVIGNNPRINNLIPYGHRKDKMFDAQWAAQMAFGFIGAPYFVPNTYITPQENFNWLVANMPTNAGAILLDIELTMTGWSPQQYSDFVKILCNLCTTKWNVAIYTGEWFTGYVNPWPDNVWFWWSEFPNTLDPTPVESWTWAQFTAKANSFTGPLNATAIPDKKLFAWQCTGSTSTRGLFLPGSNKIMDVSLCYWTQDQLESFYKQKIGIVIPTPIPNPIPDPIPQPTTGLSVITTVNLNLRSSPTTFASIILTEKIGSILVSLESDDATKSKVGRIGLWLNVKDNIGNTGYVSCQYLKLQSIIQQTGNIGLMYVVPHNQGNVTGPAVSPCYRNTKGTPDNMSMLPYDSWSKYLLQINTYDNSGKQNDRLAWIDAFDGGPTKGVSSGKYAWIGLDYPGNVIMAKTIFIGDNGKQWVEQEFVSNSQVPDFTQINYIKTPWLVHQAFGWTLSNQLFPLTSAKGGCVIPVVGDQPWYIPRSEVRPISITSNTNVRTGPGINFDRVRTEPAGKNIYFMGLTERKTITDDLWGILSDGNYMAIKIAGKQFTDVNF